MIPTMDNKMRRDPDAEQPDEKDELLRRAGGMSADDGKNPLRADVLGSIAGSNPNDVGYLGRINHLVTAHGALDAAPSPLMGSNSRTGALGRINLPANASDGTPRGDASSPVPKMGERPSLMKSGTEQRSFDPSLGDKPHIAGELPGEVGARLPLMGAPQKRGWLGKIGQVASRMGNVLGDVFAPGEMALIPGTDLNKKIEANREQARQLKERQLATEETKAGAERTTAETRAKLEPSEEAKNLAEAAAAGKGKTPDEATFKDLLTGNNGQPRINPKTQQPYTPLEAFQEVTAAKTGGKETQEQNKLAFQGVVGKLDAAGLPTDPKSIDKSLDTARKRGIITPQEHSTARAYQAANPTPGTNLTVQLAGAQGKEDIKKAGQHYTYTDDDGTTHLVTGDRVPAGVDAVPVKDPQAFIGEAGNANIVQKSFAKLAKDDLSIFDNVRARAVLATALSEEGARSMGLLVAGTGGSINMPAGSGKIIDQFLENNAVPQALRRQVKDYIADYWAMKDKMLMVQMAMQNGKMGRGNKAYFDAMVSQLPGAGTADAQMARRQLADFNETLTELKKRYPDKFGGYRKEPDLKPEEFGGGDSNVPPPGAKIRDYTQLSK